MNKDKGHQEHRVMDAHPTQKEVQALRGFDVWADAESMKLRVVRTYLP